MKKVFLLFFALANIHVCSAQSVVQEFLDINDIKAGFLNQGDMFWNPATNKATYEYPKGSGKHANFGNTLWIGGKNRTTNNLHMATQGWRSIGSEYWPGPLNASGQITQQTSDNWNQIWKVDKSKIDAFNLLSSHTMSNTPAEILEWPAKGNVHAKTPSNTQLIIPNRNMAPFIDVNHDGVYNALDGDHPQIKGEQMLWWIMNDNLDTHPLSLAPALGIEIHASAYACTGIYKEFIFLDLEIKNRSINNYDSLVVAIRSESDLGHWFDDYIGFDSSRRMGIAYNGDLYDDGFNGYGNDVPHSGTMLLKSPKEQWSFSERAGAFTFFNSGWNTRDAAPSSAGQYYNYMTGRWSDSAFFQKGCDPLNGGTAPYPYVFTGEPQDTSTISEPTCNRVPSDRRFVLSAMPVSFDTGDNKLVRYAFLTTYTGGNMFSFNRIKQKADIIKSNPDCCVNLGIPQNVKQLANSSFQVYPNPAKNYIIIEDQNTFEKSIALYNSFGQLIHQQTSSTNKTIVSTKTFASGLYFLKIKKVSNTYSQTILLDK